ncbi:DUF4153 domain-containing protein [Sphingobacteriales bacterium UPWRP_1]|nr:hypothetical protein BVG80_11675 [Sphingobacteriales bacterium TSM_CSM]PSJ72769.1 DUF4153 domain-containing protein [Sphingobacteriales bacterium UPWRP_1]
MRLPSFSYILSEIREILFRFPAICLTTLVGTATAYYMVGNYHIENDAAWVNLVMTCLLGIPFLLSLALFAEQREKTATENNRNFSGYSLVAQLAGLVLLVLYYFLLPDSWNDSPMYFLLQFALFETAAHFGVAIAPFVAKGNTNQFWQYNQTLFIRFLTAALFSGVLYLGLALALVSIDNLFNVSIPDRWYAQLFVVLAGMFNTLFFLSGVPLPDMTTREANEPYPRGLKIFTQYVLLPLVAIYLLILYSYMGKIILEARLPKGWVSYLVLGFSVAGILSQLLVYPIRNQSENAWVRTFSKWFYFLLVPLVVLLYIAALRRVFDYGITELRYLLLLLTLWLTGITVYFIFSKIKNIKILPLTLCLLALFSAFGPWGASGVSRMSQQHRLKKVLQENNLLNAAGKVQASGKQPEQAARDKIASSVEYLYRTHGLSSLQPLFEQDLQAIMDKDTAHLTYAPAMVQQLMGIDAAYYGTPTGQSINYYSTSNNAIRVSGYDILINNISADFYGYVDTEHREITDIQEVAGANGKMYRVAVDPNNRSLLLKMEETPVWSANIDSFAQTVYKKHGNNVADIASDDMQLSGTGAGGVKVALLLNSISGVKSDSSILVNYVSGQMLLKFPE